MSAGTGATRKLLHALTFLLPLLLPAPARNGPQAGPGATALVLETSPVVDGKSTLAESLDAIAAEARE